MGIKKDFRLLTGKLPNFKNNLKVFEFQWKKERQSIDGLKQVKKRIEETKALIEKAERQGDLEQAAKLKYGELPNLEKQRNLMDKAHTEEDKTPETKLLREIVDPELISRVVSSWTGIPVDKMVKSESEKLLNMEKLLSTRVVGQNQALTVVSDAIRRSRSSLADPNKPIGAFLFLGPTGVGKNRGGQSPCRIYV